MGHVAPSVDAGTVHISFPLRQLGRSYLSPDDVAHWRTVVLQVLLAASWFSGILKSRLVGFVSIKKQFLCPLSLHI